MLYLVTGGSASGKSAYAEQLLTESRAEYKFYIATMQPFGAEGRSRVEKHRKMRAGKGFQTIECYQKLEKLKLPGEKESSAVLLECMSNLTANEMFEVGGSDLELVKRIENGVECLREQAELVVIVTNEIFSDGALYEPETLQYRALLGTVNQNLAKLADHVTEVVYGIPVAIK